jgi:hypothetical protein
MIHRDKMMKVRHVDVAVHGSCVQAAASMDATPCKPKRVSNDSSALLSPHQSPGDASELSDVISCMHMPPPPTGPIGALSDSRFLPTATIGGGGRSPEKEGLAAMMPQVLKDHGKGLRTQESSKQNKTAASEQNSVGTFDTALLCRRG